MFRVLTIAVLVSFAVIFTAKTTLAQNNEKVRISPKAEVMQVVGFTEITIDYSSPGVKGRKIWGGLVPYNKVWRAGANEATKITFADDVKINGKKLKAGSYSFFAIPTKGQWTLIFNKVADQWGAFEYNEAEDALRIKSEPVKSCWQEWLKYEINKKTDSAAIITLEWEKLKVPFLVEVSIK